MMTRELPPRDEMLRAVASRDSSYEGVFITAVKTTGIFCRPGCPARSPQAQNVEFYPTTRDALLAGYRPCRRCRPLEPAGTPPSWLRPLLDEVDADPTRRLRDADLRELGLSPARVRRWFQTQHGMSFHAYSRARRLGEAMGRMKAGDGVLDAAYDAGYGSLSGFGEAFQRYFGEAPSRTRDALVLRVERLTTPLGPMLAAASDDALYLLEFVDRRMLPTQVERLRRRTGCVYAPGRSALHGAIAGQLGEYFEGRRRHFDLPCELPGTDFQQAVWQELLRIPAGETRSYSELASTLGRPQAVRAVARANGDNRLAILVPCHRVIGANGDLTGYGGGLWRKKKLLELEAAALS